MVPYTGTWTKFSSSIFSVMTQEANKAGAVNLAQGFPDFDGPESVKEAAIAAIRAGKNQYAAAAGLPELRQAIAKRAALRYGLTYSAEHEVTVFSGATEALFCTIMALCEPGDELLTFEPYYDSYLGSAVAARATLVPVRLAAPDWQFDATVLRQSITPRTKAILLNTPHNPTGKVFTASELSLIADLARAHDLYVITDEVYEELTFDGSPHLSFATLPGMQERTIVISSTSKTFSFTGWKVGYAYAPPQISQALRAVHQFVVFCSATPLQAGLVEAFNLPPSYYEDFRQSYAKRRQLMVDLLTASGFRVTAPGGTYFIMADYSALSDLGDYDFAIWLARTAKVAAIPVSPFYLDPAAISQQQRYLRFAFCKEEDTIAAAGERLSNLKALL